jgi:hypothetical protein
MLCHMLMWGKVRKVVPCIDLSYILVAEHLYQQKLLIELQIGPERFVRT